MVKLETSDRFKQNVVRRHLMIDGVSNIVIFKTVMPTSKKSSPIKIQSNTPLDETLLNHKVTRNTTFFNKWINKVIKTYP